MKKHVVATVLTAMLLTLGCTTSPTAVRGHESAGGAASGWTSTEGGSTVGTSDITYLGASADGKIIVRRADGRVELWGRN